MLTDHNYIVFLSETHTGCDFLNHGQPFLFHHTQACWYSMRRSLIFSSRFCVPDAHSVSGYPVFSTDAVSVSFSRISFLLSSGIRKQLYLHGSHIQVSAFLLSGLIFPTISFEFWKRIRFPGHAGWLPFLGSKASLGKEHQNQNGSDSFSLYVSGVLLH